jgi:inorganic pyrophosphatase
MKKSLNIAGIPAERDDGLINAIIETPKGSHCKNKYLKKHNIFELGKPLPAGLHFPYDFGFIPGTLSDDGDCLDVMVLSDYPIFAGCLVPARLIGVLKAKQKEKNGKAVRNDRLIARVEFDAAKLHVKSVKQFNSKFCKEIEAFFISYNEQSGKEFYPLGWQGPEAADKLLKAGKRRFSKSS